MHPEATARKLLPMNNTLRVAIVGGGGGGLAQVRYFRAIPGVEVAWIVDPHPERIHTRFEQWGNRPPMPAVTADIDEVLRDNSVDLVSVCTPDATHAQYCVASFEAGKNVVAEKPLSNSRSDCLRIGEAWKRSGKVGAVQHQFRYEPWCAKVVELVQGGAIGDLVSVHGEYVHNLIERSRIYHPWRFEGPDAHAAMPAAGVHFIDLFHWLVNSNIVDVSAIGNKIAFPDYPDNDCVLSHFRFENGVVGRLMVNLGAQHPPYFPLKAFGTKGTLTDGYLVTEKTIERVLDNPPIFTPPPIPLGIKTITHGPRRILSKIKREILNRVAPGSKPSFSQFSGKIWQMEYQHIVACTKSLCNVVEAIRHNRRPLVTMDEAAKACEVAFAATDSSRHGGELRKVSDFACRTPQADRPFD